MEIGETDDILNVQEIMRLVQISDKNSLKPSFKNSKLEFSKNGSKNDSKNDSKYDSKTTSETSTDFYNKISNWNNLPPELLISILLKLPIQDVYRTASTNKNWYSIFAQNNYLWKNLFYREFGRPDPNPVQNSYNPFNSLNLEGQSENSAENNINNDSFSSIPENLSINSSEIPTTTLPTVTTLPTSTSNTLENISNPSNTTISSISFNSIHDNPEFVQPTPFLQPESEVNFKKAYHSVLDMTPKVSTHVFDECQDEVLHVNFSPDGQMIAICSKDAVFRVYDAEYPYSLFFSQDMSNSDCTKWEWCQAAGFSPNSQNVMVSGVFSRSQPYLGELAVFSISGDKKTFNLESRIQIKPHDVFGCWYGNENVISCKTQWHEGYPLVSEVYNNKTRQNTEDPGEGVVKSIFKFANKNWSVIRMLNTVKIFEAGNVLKSGDYIIAAKGSRVWTPHELGFKKLSRNQEIPDIRNTGIVASPPGVGANSGDSSSRGSSRSRNSSRNNQNSVFQYPENRNTAQPMVTQILQAGQIQQNNNNTQNINNPNPNSVWAEILNDSESSQQVHSTLKLDEWDHELVYQGQIIGFEVLEKHQRLLINVRDWSLTDEEIETLNDPDENSPFDPASPPALSKFPRLIIFDLNLWTPIRELTGHEALSPANRCCFLMPSASGRFAACGDETGKVYRKGVKWTEKPRKSSQNPLKIP